MAYKTLTTRRRGRAVQATLVALLAAALLAMGAAATAQSQRFPDVPPSHDAYEAVEWAASVGLTSGYGDGTFKPDEALARWRAMAFMEKFYDEVLKVDASDGFTSGDLMVVLHAIHSGATPPATTTVPATTTTTAPSGDTGQWEQFEGTFQGIDPQPYVGIQVEASEVWDHSSIYGDDFAHLLIRCSQGETDMFIVWDGLVFGHWEDDRVTMDWRWDQQPVISATAYEGSNAAATFITAPAAADFAGKSELRVQTYNYSDGDAEKGALFDVSGYVAARDRWLRNCGNDI